MREILGIIAIAFCITGCATNPCSQFYQDYTDGQGVVENPMLIASEKEPVVQQGSDPNEDGIGMMRNGYDLIGKSSFNGASVPSSKAKYHARNVGAEIVLLYCDYTETLSGSIPITTPDTTTITSHGSASAYGSGSVYGSGGYANYSGSGTARGSSYTTVQGSKTTYIPYNTRRYDYLATFWARLKPLSGAGQKNDNPRFSSFFAAYMYLL